MSDKPSKKKIRLDQLLVQRGLAQSRERARALIMAGLAVVNDHKITKAGQSVPDDAEVRLKGNDCPYVSRGGLKLEGALDHFGLDVKDFLCIDMGASTGGFSDCLLSRGARKIYTFDVGRNQLAWSMRNDSRIVWRESFHVKNLQRSDVPEDRVDLIVIDVSFISLRMALPPLFPFMKESSRLLAMVKPQFELGRDRIGKGGIVRDRADQLEAVEMVSELLRENGFSPSAPCPSPVKGPKGNQEYFLFVDR